MPTRRSKGDVAEEVSLALDAGRGYVGRHSVSGYACFPTEVPLQHCRGGERRRRVSRRERIIATVRSCAPDGELDRVSCDLRERSVRLIRSAPTEVAFGWWVRRPMA